MNSSRLIELTASELAGLIAGKELSPVEVTQAYLERIDDINPKLNAYITVCADEAMQAAQEAERAVVDGDSLGPLHGLPLAVKDQFETKGILTTAGSRILADYTPDHDATVIARARDAGAILIGKLNMTQFAAGGGDPYPFGEAHNPWNPERTPGLSSSGSGIAIAASLAAITLGEDTGGSIRMPASVNGIVGLRPTWGRVSRYGMLPFCWSMDTAGPMTRTVEDAALVMNAIAGYDHNDPQTSRLPVPDYTASLTRNLNGVRIGVLKELMPEDTTHTDVFNAVTAAATQLGKLGASVEEVSLPGVNDVAIVAAAISESDGAFVHREWLRTRPGNYGQNTRRRLIAGSLIPAQVVHKAARIRTLFRQEWQRLLERFDAVISPTMLNLPGNIEHVDGVASREEAERRFGHRGSVTFPAAFLGIPALSVPCGLEWANLPVGFQIMTGHFEDGLALRIGHAYQESTEWHTMRPDV